MKSANKKTFYIIIGLVLAIAVGGVLISNANGDLFKGSLRDWLQIQKAPILKQVLDSRNPYTPYKGVCIVRDLHATSPTFPLYADPDSGLGYEKISTGTNFYSTKEVDDSCTEEILTTLGATFCSKYPEGSYLRESGTHWWEADGEHYTIGSLHPDWINCSPHQVLINVSSTSPSGARPVSAKDRVAGFNISTDNGYASIRQISFNFVSDTGSIDPGSGVNVELMDNFGNPMRGTSSIVNIDAGHAEILYTLHRPWQLDKNTTNPIHVFTDTATLLNEQAGVDDHLLVTLQSMDAGTATTNVPVDALLLSY